MATSADRLARHPVITRREKSTLRRHREAATAAPAAQPSVYGYCRVSTVQQAQEGESLDVQQRMLTGYCQMHGLIIDRTFIERGVSASRPLAQRPAGAALLAALKPGDVIVCAKLDRVFRSALDALGMLQQFQRDNIALHLLDLGGDVSTNHGNALAKITFTIAAAFAEAERARTKERICEIKLDQKRRGRFLGGSPPFGWRVGESGELVPLAEQQRAIDRMKELRAKGLSLRAIAAALQAEGTKLSHMCVQKSLRGM